MWGAVSGAGGDERVGVVKLRFSKAELAAAAAELAAEAAARDSASDDFGGFGSDGGGEPLLPAPAEEDDDGFDFDVRAFSDDDAPPSPQRYHEPEPAQELIDHAVWAKLRGYPAWPAQVLSVHAGHEAPPQPRPGCVLVHFFGTYDIQWLDNEKKVSPFRDNFEQYAAASKQKPFLKAVAEAQHFEATGGAAGGELPAGMTGLYQGATTSNFGDLILKPKAAKTAKAGRGAKRGAGGGAGGGASGVPRRVRVARFLGLLPPAGGALQPLPILPCP